MAIFRKPIIDYFRKPKAVRESEKITRDFSKNIPTPQGAKPLPDSYRPSIGGVSMPYTPPTPQNITNVAPTQPGIGTTPIISMQPQPGQEIPIQEEARQPFSFNPIAEMYGGDVVYDEQGNKVLLQRDEQKRLREESNKEEFFRSLVPYKNGNIRIGATGDPVLDLINLGALSSLPLTIKDSILKSHQLGDMIERGYKPMTDYESLYGNPPPAGALTSIINAFEVIKPALKNPKVWAGATLGLAGFIAQQAWGMVSSVDAIGDTYRSVEIAKGNAKTEEERQAYQSIIDDMKFISNWWGVVSAIYNKGKFAEAGLEIAKISKEFDEAEIKVQEERDEKNREYVNLISQAWGTEGGYNRLLNDQEFQSWITQNWNTEAGRLYEAFNKDIQRILNNLAYGGTDGSGTGSQENTALYQAQAGFSESDRTQREEPSTLKVDSVTGGAAEYVPVNKDRADALLRYKDGTASNEDLALILYGVPIRNLNGAQRKELANWK